MLLCVNSSFAIILKRKRKLVALLLLSYRCIVTINVMWLFLTVPWVGLQCVILVFPDHTHLLFGAVLLVITDFLQEVCVVRWLCLALLQRVQGSNISEYCRHYQRSYYEVCLFALVLGHRPILVKRAEIGSKGGAQHNI